ncbi:MAG: aspartate kinase [Bacteroidales bacterium]
MIVHKFGGGAIKDAEGVKNMYDILRKRKEEKVVVMSAFGKTTNELESVTEAIYNKQREHFLNLLEKVKTYHFDIIDNLFPLYKRNYEECEKIFEKIDKIAGVENNNYDFLYDQVVCLGEILSTKIVSSYLEYKGMNVRWIDIRSHLKTDNVFREANVDREISDNSIKENFRAASEEVLLTQGFIGGTDEGYSTTLGREGSDYTAALLANILNADKTIVWKDVPGVLNADPRYFDNPEKIDEISYREAIELAYYGAKIIHPKTIKPLENKSIPLYVKSFLNPDEKGTCISKFSAYTPGIPVFIKKENQMLLSIVPKDMSFVFEERLSKIYKFFALYRIKVNLIQNSAVNFTVSVDEHNPRIYQLIDGLRTEFKVLYNKGLELITIRHYNKESLDELIEGRKVLVEQKSRHTVQLLLEV